jgi:hypothetical protein
MQDARRPFGNERLKNANGKTPPIGGSGRWEAFCGVGGAGF